MTTPTFVDKTLPSQHATLTFELDLKHRPEKVWRALTDPVLLAEWMLPIVEQRGGAFSLERGASFTLQTQPRPPWDGTVKCRYLDVEPMTKLSFAWVVGSMDIDTVVTFTLTPATIDGVPGTRLGVVHTGFKPDQKGASGGQRYGWGLWGAGLVAALERMGST